MPVGRSARCERTIWNASPARMKSLHARTPRSYSACAGKRLVAARRPRLARRTRDRRLEQRRDLVGVAAEHLGDAADVVEADEHVGDDEAALRQPAPVVRHRHGRLERRDEVVAEVADDRLAAALGLLVGQEPRAAADERVAPEPALLDGLEQEARTAGGAQVQVGPERGEEVGVEEAGDGHQGRKKTLCGSGWSGGGLSCGLGQARAPAPLVRQAHQVVREGKLIATTIGARAGRVQSPRRRRRRLWFRR